MWFIVSKCKNCDICIYKNNEIVLLKVVEHCYNTNNQPVISLDVQNQYLM